MPLRPRDAAQDCLDRANGFLAVARRQKDPVKKADLVRMGLVMGVAALDTYMHLLVLQRVAVVRASELPKSLRGFDIPLGDMAALADAVVLSRHLNRARKKPKEIRPWVQVKNALQGRLLQETFQSYDAVGSAFAMAGVTKAWSRIAEQLGCSADDIKKHLSRLVHRRNQVVHEGDLQRGTRLSGVKHNTIDHAVVADDITWLEELLDAIESVVAAS
ncbi:MAG: hypothetical protein AMXMBFR56_37230 [Polyangiaceae bacterium]